MITHLLYHIYTQLFYNNSTNIITVNAISKSSLKYTFRIISYPFFTVLVYVYLESEYLL